MPKQRAKPQAEPAAFSEEERRQYRWERTQAAKAGNFLPGEYLVTVSGDMGQFLLNQERELAWIGSVLPQQPAPASNGHQAKKARKQPGDSLVMDTEEVETLLHMDRNEVYKLGLPEYPPHKPGKKHHFIKSAVYRTLEEQANGKTR